MTQYLLSVWHDWDDVADVSAQDVARMSAQVDAFNRRVQDAGAWVFAGGLGHPGTATTVDATRGEAVLTDGPFIETKEQLGGFWVVEAPDLDAALGLAREASAACERVVEVRPFQGV